MLDRSAREKTLSCAQVREVDRLAIEELKMPGIVLMENAGRNVARIVHRVLLRHLRRLPSEANVVVVCGGGNNGGDGYVVARHLANRGAKVRIFATKATEALRGDAAVNATIALNMGLPLVPIVDAEQLATRAGAWDEADVLVDALLGTGFSGPVRGHLRLVIQRINAAKARQVLAVDLPSGLDGDTGEALQGAVRADWTTTLVAAKHGFLAPSARKLLGRVVVAGIGVPPGLIDRVVKGSPG